MQKKIGYSGRQARERLMQSHAALGRIISASAVPRDCGAGVAPAPARGRVMAIDTYAEEIQGGRRVRVRLTQEGARAARAVDAWDAWTRIYVKAAGRQISSVEAERGRGYAALVERIAATGYGAGALSALAGGSVGAGKGILSKEEISIARRQRLERIKDVVLEIPPYRSGAAVIYPLALLNDVALSNKKPTAVLRAYGLAVSGDSQARLAGYLMEILSILCVD